MKINLVLGVLLELACIVYLAGAFYNVSFNIGEWTEDSRGNCVVAFMFFGAMGTIIAFLRGASKGVKSHD